MSFVGISHLRGQASESRCSVNKVGHLSSFNPVSRAERAPGVILGTLKKLVLLPVKECCCVGVNMLDGENEGKQAKNKASFFCILLSGLPA